MGLEVAPIAKRRLLLWQNIRVEAAETGHSEGPAGATFGCKAGRRPMPMLGGKAALRFLGLVNIPRLTGQRPEISLAALGVRVATIEAMNSLSAADRARSVVIVQDSFTSYLETPLLEAMARVI